jgi:hypothetical protein
VCFNLYVLWQQRENRRLWTEFPHAVDINWRVRTNQEIKALIKEENRVRFIKSQRLAWYGHVNRIEDNKNVKAIMKWNPTDRRSCGRPKTRWKDDVEADLRAMKITNWRTRIEDKLAWKKIVEQDKTHPGL